MTEHSREEALLIKNLIGATIAGFEQKDDKLVIWRENSSRNTAIHLDRVVGPIKKVEYKSSYEAKSTDVSKWVNSDEFSAPNSTIPGAVQREVVPCNHLRFIGRTIVRVGAYTRKEKKLTHYTVSLQTTTPETRNDSKAKIETLVIGITVGK